MMGRTIRNVALAAAVALAVPATGHAQSIYFGAGGLFGVGDFGDATDPGFMGVAGLSFDLGDSGASVGAEGMYGTAGGIDDGPDATLYSAMGYLLYGFGDGETVSPYIFGGAGLLGVDVDDSGTGSGGSETEFGYQAGVGLDIPLGGDNVGLFVEGRYMGSSDVDLIGALAGVGISLGG